LNPILIDVFSAPSAASPDAVVEPPLHAAVVRSRAAASALTSTGRNRFMGASFAVSVVRGRTWNTRALPVTLARPDRLTGFRASQSATVPEGPRDKSSTDFLLLAKLYINYMPFADAQRSAFVLLLRELQDATAQANLTVARGMGLSATDASAMEHIVFAATPLGPAELSTRLGVTRSSATEIVDRLVRSGLIERRRDEVDGRRFRLLPTESARERVMDKTAPLRARVDEAGESLTPQQQRTVSEFLQAITRAHLDFADSETSKG